MATAGDERYLVCAVVVAAAVSSANWFFPLCFARSAGFGFLVVNRIGINGCMIVGMLCCHVVVQIAPWRRDESFVTMAKSF